MTDTEPELVPLEPTTVALVRETVRMDALRDFYDRAYGRVMQVIQQQDLAPAGPALGVYFSMPTDTVDVGAGFPTSDEVTPVDGVSALVLPGGRAVRIEHHGSYDSLPATYEQLVTWVQEGRHPMGDLLWESYVTEPTPEADPESMVTVITWPLAT
jgi:effector-binding domain-containing protein